MNTLSFDVRFDPALLHVNGVAKDSAAVLRTAVLNADLSQAASGLIRIQLTGLSSLPATAVTLLNLQASVPASAPYAAKHLLDIQRLQFNGGALSGSDDDGIHLVAYVGDTDAQPGYSMADALCVQRVVVRLDTGFLPYPWIDPLIAGDVNGNGRLDAGDALLIGRKVMGLPTSELPDLPAPLRMTGRTAPNPALEIRGEGQVRAAQSSERIMPATTTQSTGESGTPAPVINWAAAASVAVSPDVRAGASWKSDFVNNLGRSETSQTTIVRLDSSYRWTS